MKPRPLLERFNEKVEKTSGCWFWTAYVDQCGYGRIQVGRTSRHAHRVAFELFVAPIPAGLEIGHLCHVRSCVNPAHLRPMTHAENLRMSPHIAKNAIRDACKRGHPMEDPNLRYLANGTRQCKACWVASYQRRNAAVSAQRKVTNVD